MMTTRVLAIAMCLAAGAAVLSAATMKEIKLAEGYDETNRIAAPIYENAGLPSVAVTVTAGYDRKAKLVRAMGGRMSMTRGPEYDLDPKIDLATLLTEAFRSEALAMGLSSAAAGSSWRVTGTLKDIYLESKQIPFGLTLFYGYMDVDLQVTNPAGQSQTRRLRVHTSAGDYNAGLGRRDEAASATAHLLVEGAQEILARLNRELFKAPPHRDMSATLDRLKGSVTDAARGDLRMVGLSGLTGAASVLLTMVGTQQEENLRTRLIDALALLGSRDAVDVLADRYATEDEDCRWYTLKAMDYIGGPEADRLVSTLGIADDDTGPKRLAGRITAKPAR